MGGLFETVLGFMLKPLAPLLPGSCDRYRGAFHRSVPDSVGVGSFGGGSSAKDYGSMENLLLGTLVLVVIIALKHGTKGMTSVSSILIGIIVGYIVAAIMALVLPPPE